MDGILQLVTLVLQEDIKDDDLILEQCSQYDTRLSGFQIVLKKEKKQEVIDYIKTNHIHPDHLTEIFAKQPTLTMELLLKEANTDKDSFTMALLDEYGIDSLRMCPSKESFNTVVAGQTAPDKKYGYGERLAIDYMDVEPVQIQICGDYNGKLSDIMDHLAFEIDQVVVPFEFTEIFTQVLSLQRYDVRIFKGKRYALSKNIRNDKICQYKEQAIESLKSGIPFKESLWTDIEYQGKPYQTLKLGVNEWTMLCNMFRSYDAGVYETADDLLLIIG